MSTQGFYAHIQDAITINKRRKIAYAALSGGKTKCLSNALIISEKLTLPIAKYYDRKGKFFNEQGIMIVRDDFVDMDIPPFDTDLIHRSPWTDQVGKPMKDLLKKFLADLPKKFETQESIKVVLENGKDLYFSIEALEKSQDVHIPMTKHLLESICLISKNGLDFSTQSKGATRSLTGSLIKLHRLALKNSLWMDKWGNRFHQQNIGILVNDMPKIEVEGL